jgi:very-short-patch-repair endonuclease
VPRWWEVPPPLQVSYLAGVDPELLAIDLDPLPAGALAVVQFRPAALVAAADHVTVILDELDRAALALFPAWLPGAERLEGPQGHGVAAVRVLAAEAAARSSNFGPFLADLAERALRGSTGGRPRFPAEVRAAGLARVVADAYGRHGTALLMHVPAGLDPAAERNLTRAAEWLAHRGPFTVWLAGAPLHTVERIRSVPITLPAHLTQLAAEAQLIPLPAPAGAEHVLMYPPLSGQPRRDSPAETTLERALAPHEWARGRRWNHTYEWHILGQIYRLDLFWPTEGLVVEVDGPEHRQHLQFADDHRRDVQLHLLGHDVLRFTNDQVLTDAGAVVEKLRQMLHHRRSVKEKIAHVEH